MKLYELIEQVEHDDLEAKQRIAYGLLKTKLSEVKRARKILAKLESQLDELKSMDVDDLETTYNY